MRRFATIFLLALVVTPLASAAAKAPAFGLRALGNPKLGYFVYSLSPGAVHQGGVIISNSGTATGTVKLFAADATTGNTTGTVYLTDRKAKHAGAWISLAKTTLTLKPGQHRTVPFTVRVPASTKPGQWVGGVVAETSHQVSQPKSKNKASVRIKIRDLTIVAVQVNVPGPPVLGFTIGGVTTGGQRGFQQIVTHIANTGNVLVKPTGTVTVLNKQGAKLQVLTFKMDTFLPQTAIDYPLLLKKALAPGDYSANVRLAIPGVAGAAARVVTAHPSFSISKQDVKQVFTSAAPQAPPPTTAGSSSSSKAPWALIGGAVLVALLLALLVFQLLRRRRTPKAATPPPVPAPLSPEPAPEAAEPEEPVLAEAEAAQEARQAVSEQTRSPECDPHHYWDVAYDRGELGDDGIWRFPHRCRNCGLELLARDVDDATAHADALPA
jgi:WxL interacting protein linking bacterial and host surfaces